MSILPIVQYDAKSIRQKSTEVSKSDIVSGKLKSLVKDMKESMIKEDGIGIAAPQIGINRQVIIILTKDGQEVIYNPKILKKSIRKEKYDEGCLSVKGIFGPVARHRSVKVEGLNDKGERMVYDAKGLMARVFQHEVDHLNGHLFIDRVKKISQGEFDLKKWIVPV